MRKQKYTTSTYNVADAISQAISELTELRDEVQEVFYNMPESLQGGDRAQRLEEAAEVLDDVDCLTVYDELDCATRPDDTVSLGGVTFTCQVSAKRRPSRADRRDNAVELLRVAIATVQAELEEDAGRSEEEQKWAAVRDDVESCVDDLESLCDNAEGAEFPGMYG